MGRYVKEEAICRLIKFDGNHCGSCHYDADEGYGELLEIDDFGKDRYSLVCCSVLIAFEKWQEDRGASNVSL